MVTYRRTTKVGPFRFTFTPRGVSTSVGVKGARVSLGSNGKVRRTFSIPGTGIRDTKVVGQLGRKSASPPRAVRSTPPTVPSAPRVSAQAKGMTMLELQQFLTESAAAGVPADAVPTVRVTFGGHIKRIGLS